MTGIGDRYLSRRSRREDGYLSRRSYREDGYLSRRSYREDGYIKGLVLAALVLTAIGCGGDVARVAVDKAHPPPDSGADGWLRGTGIRQTRYSRDGGAIEAVLSADEMVLDHDNRFVMTGVSLETVTDDGRSVQATAARIATDSVGEGDATLDGGIEVRIDDVRIRCEAATWMAAAQQVVGPGPVTVTGDRMVLHGGKFVVDTATRNFQVYTVSGSVFFDDSVS